LLYLKSSISYSTDGLKIKIKSGGNCPLSTPYHAKYYAAKLRRRSGSGDIDQLSMSLFDASVDLNPHQIEAALFACRSPLSKGVLLADEVGLGKTIEAGLVLCQYWAERRRRLIVICPAALRKQWSLELAEKFNLPSMILEAKSFKEALRSGSDNPFSADSIVITSLNFATLQKELVKLIPWDLAVIDEAHKLRNAYRPSNRMGQGIRWALEDRKKLLLTATPLQNSLLELYGLSTLIDEQIFGDLPSFREQYTGSSADLDALKRRLAGFAKRTLRSQVLEYIRYTERRAITRPFRPSDQEQSLYEAISNFLQRADTYAIPDRQRTLTTLIVRKLLASSTQAVAGTLETIKQRLETLRAGLPEPENLLEKLVEGDELGMISWKKSRKSRLQTRKTASRKSHSSRPSTARSLMLKSPSWTVSSPRHDRSVSIPRPVPSAPRLRSALMRWRRWGRAARR